MLTWNSSDILHAFIGAEMYYLQINWVILVTNAKVRRNLGRSYVCISRTVRFKLTYDLQAG